MGDEVYIYLSVFVTGLLGIWKAVPVGFALGLNPVWIYGLTVSGATVAALILFWFGEWFRKMLYRKKGNKPPSKKEGRAGRLFEKYGTPGLGFIGTLLIGPNATLLIGFLLVTSRKKLLWWTIAGIWVWTLVLTLMAASGIALFKSI